MRYLSDALRVECARRYRECIRSYPYTPAGERQIHLYATARQAAQSWWDTLATHTTVDVEQVLAHLLPHADTRPHRARAVWITPAPAIQGDAKSWFEDAGWVSPQAWPTVITALLRFIRRCSAAPEALLNAIETLTQDLAQAQQGSAMARPPAGFQSGMLSPILHALRPDAYCVCDAPVRRVVNWLSDTHYGPRLMEYPAANTATLAIIAELAPILDQHDAPLLSAGDRFDLFARWLVNVKHYDFRGKRRWRFPLRDADEWRDWQLGGHIALDGPPGDLSITAALVEGDPLLKILARELRAGDTVLASQGRRMILGQGRVLGPYFHLPNEPAPHRVPIAWEDLPPLRLEVAGWTKRGGALEGTVTRALATRSSLSRLDVGEHMPLPPPMMQIAEVASPYTIGIMSVEELAATTLQPPELLAGWARAIARKGQAILYGPPGTGKTYLAEHLARWISARDGMWEMLQFHPAYAYEDFVQGLRPVASADGTMRYALVPGRFAVFCERAAAHTGPCVLVIDEINRADPIRVFGEVLSLLEYREQSLPLAGGGNFAIPANVRIIGTMNTADRATILLDYALRRRFAFLHVPPQMDVLRRYHARMAVPIEGLVAILQAINHTIDDPRLAIGISYFLRPDLPDHLAEIWRQEIEPLLEEWWFDRPELVDRFRWERVRERIGW